MYDLGAILQRRNILVGGALARECLVWQQVQLLWTIHQQPENRLQLKTVAEQIGTSEDVESETGTGHGDDQTTDVANVSDCLGSNQRDEDEVVLLTFGMMGIDIGNVW